MPFYIRLATLVITTLFPPRECSAQKSRSLKRTTWTENVKLCSIVTPALKWLVKLPDEGDKKMTPPPSQKIFLHYIAVHNATHRVFVPGLQVKVNDIAMLLFSIVFDTKSSEIFDRTARLRHMPCKGMASPMGGNTRTAWSLPYYYRGP